MHNISEAEARNLLSRPLICEDVGNWTPVKIQPDTWKLGAGVVDENGISVQMYVELLYRRSYRTKITKYLFTLFKRYSYGRARVYQLEVTQTPKRMKDMHKFPHEHIGSCRSRGDAKWAEWEYHDVLAHFCAQANITFRPVPAHPEDFQLTGD